MAFPYLYNPSETVIPGGVNSQTPAAQVNYYAGGAGEKYVTSHETQARLYVTIPRDYSTQWDAYLKKLKGSQRFVEKITSSVGYIDFLLERVTEARAEKYQPVELLADDYVAYFFGQAIPTITFSGVLFSTIQDPWWTAFTHLYNDILRGSRLAQFQATAHLRYDGRVAHGALTAFEATLSSDRQMAVSFSATMMVKEVQLVPSRKEAKYNYTSTITEPVGEASAGFDMSNYENAVSRNSPSQVSRADKFAQLPTPAQTPQQVLGAVASAPTSPWEWRPFENGPVIAWPGAVPTGSEAVASGLASLVPPSYEGAWVPTPAPGTTDGSPTYMAFTNSAGVTWYMTMSQWEQFLQMGSDMRTKAWTEAFAGSPTGGAFNTSLLY